MGLIYGVESLLVNCTRGLSALHGLPLWSNQLTQCLTHVSWCLDRLFFPFTLKVCCCPAAGLLSPTKLASSMPYPCVLAFRSRFLLWFLLNFAGLNFSSTPSSPHSAILVNFFFFILLLLLLNFYRFNNNNKSILF